MLYVTTRNKMDAYTAFRVLKENRGPDGGLYVPMRLPRLGPLQIAELKEKSFGQCVAEILNLFFFPHMDGGAVDFTIGRRPVKLVPMSHRIIIAETWHNQDRNFAHMVQSLTGCKLGSDSEKTCPSNWAWIAVRIATLFGLFAELERSEIWDPTQPMDIAMPAGDFSAPMSAWYAREMGLPIRNIICSCNENGAAWDLLHHGELHTGAVAKATNTPDVDVGVPTDLERLVYGVFGWEETSHYCSVCRRGGTYSLPEDQLERLRRGMHAAVVGQKRIESIIRSVYRANCYLMDPYAALSYGGLQDYRAVTGESGDAVLLAERSPSLALGTVAKAMGLTVQELKEKVDMT